MNRTDELAMATATARLLRSQAHTADVQQDHLHLRISQLESRLSAALDRVDTLEGVLQQQGLVLRHVAPGGVVKLIKAYGD